MPFFDFILIAVASLAAFFDLSVRKIPNWLILFGLGTGVILNLYGGLSHFINSILGFFIGIGVFVVPFLLGWMGAGDVKYLGVIGAMLGITWMPRVVFYSIVAAGIMAIGSVLLGQCRVGFLKTAWYECKIAVLSFGQILPETVSMRVQKGAYSLPWGVALSLGTILAYYMDPTGQWAGF
ncbi:MAG: prepilin peptidase [Alphaproteobacteria bacterium]